MPFSVSSLSIRNRLLIGLLVMVTIAYSVTLFRNYVDTRHEIEELLDAQLAQSARVLLELSGHELYEQLAYLKGLEDESTGISEHIQTEIHKYEQEIDFQIWIIEHNHLAVRSVTAPDEPLIDVDEIFGDRVVNGQQWRVYSLANEEKTVRIQVGQHYHERDVLSKNISVRLIASFALTLPLLALLIIFTVGRALYPLTKIARQIENRQVDNLQPVNLANVPADVQPMIKSINSLFLRLQTAFENIVVFTANAAHELRTPLAAQKVHAQVALQTKNDETRNEALYEIVSGVNRATNLVEQLLTLSRLDPEGELVDGDCANLKTIAEECLARQAASALEKNLEIGLDAEDNTVINGREAIVGILVRNLIENAIRYTPPEGTVCVSLTHEADKIRLRVSDSGPGIPPEEHENVFARFYRTQDNTEEGSGLGLAMVQRIAEIHNAEIKLGTSTQGGLQVDVLFHPSKSCPAG